MVNWLSRLARYLCSRTGAALVVLLVSAITAFAILQRREPEPTYQNIPASVWLELSNTNQQKMIEGILAFQKMGPAGAEFLGKELVRKPSKLDDWLLAHHQSIPGLLKKSLLKPQRQVRDDTILKLLSGMHTNAAPAVPSLIEWLESTNSAVGSQMVMINLHQQHGRYAPSVPPMNGPMPPGSLPTVIRSNQSRTVVYPVYGNSTIQTQVMVTAPGMVVTNYVMTSRSTSNSIPFLAFELLRTIGSTDPRVIPLLFRPVENRYPSSLSAPPFSTNLRTAALHSIPLLAQKSASQDYREKLIALALLKLTLPESSAAKDVFIQRLSDNDRQIFDYALGALHPFTNDLERIIPPALDGLRRRAKMTSQPYAPRVTGLPSTIKEFSRYSPLVISGLQEILKDTANAPDTDILQVLGELGTSNQVDLVLISSFTNHPVNAVRAKAWFAVGNITGDADAKALAQLAMMDSSALWQAYTKLGEPESAGKLVVPQLRAGLKNENERIIAKAAESLGKIGPGAKDALPDLEALRNHPHLMVREPVEDAIRKISASPKAKGAE